MAKPNFCGKTMSAEQLAQLAIDQSKVEGKINEPKLLELLSEAIHAKYAQGMRDEAAFQRTQS